MGAERAEEFGERNGVPGELTVRIRPTKVIAIFNVDRVAQKVMTPRASLPSCMSCTTSKKFSIG